MNIFLNECKPDYERCEQYLDILEKDAWRYTISYTCQDIFPSDSSDYRLKELFPHNQEQNDETAVKISDLISEKRKWISEEKNRKKTKKKEYELRQKQRYAKRLPKTFAKFSPLLGLRKYNLLEKLTCKFILLGRF